MYCYQAYGLIIHSAIALPELVPLAALDTSPDVVILQQGLPESPLLPHTATHAYQKNQAGLYLYWQSVGTFLVAEGRTILFDPDPGADEDRLRLFILGAAFGGILHQRGFFVLHASAAMLNGQAVAFMGNKGWGKSTLAATLQNRGWTVLSDDVVAIDVSNPQKPMVLPAFPQIKLWPDAVQAVCDRPDEALPLLAGSQKQQLQFHQAFQNQAFPLKQLFVLGLGTDIEVVPLSIQETIQYLLANTYVARFHDELLQGESAQQHLQQLTHLASVTPVDRLLRPVDLALLPQVAIHVEDQVQSRPDVRI